MLESELSLQSSGNSLKSKMIFDLLNAGFSNNYTLVSNSIDAITFLSADPDHMPQGEMDRTHELLQSMVRSDTTIENIMLYSVVNQSCVSAQERSRYIGDESVPWINTYRATKLPFLMFPRKENAQSFNAIYTLQEINDRNGKTIGIFCIRTRYQNFEEMVQQSFGEEPDQIYIVSDIGLILYSSDPARVNTLMFEDPDIHSAFLTAKESEGSTLFWEDSIISVSKSSSSNLILMSFTSRANVLNKYHWLNLLMGSGGVVVLLVALLSALFIAVSHYRSVASVLKAIQTADHPASLKHSYRLNSEFFYIMHSVSASANENQMLDNKLVEKVLQLKRAHLCELQAQINPHFVFNTLQLINLSILRETRRDTPATKMLSLFSRLLQSSFDTDKVIVSVAEEIQNLQVYVDIQSIRYNGRLKVQCHIDEHCLSFCTLKTMLQPFVENCMLHGFRNENEEWHLSVACKLQNETLIFTISDNGCGITPDRLREIRDKLNSPTISGQNIGISNVNQRMTLLFDNRCSVQVDSTLGQGTCITIRHPAAMEHPLAEIVQQLCTSSNSK